MLSWHNILNFMRLHPQETIPLIRACLLILRMLLWKVFCRYEMFIVTTCDAGV